MNKYEWNPVEGHIMTKWAYEVDPKCPLPEYPRPQMVREGWQNLNGLWDVAIVPKEQKEVLQYQGKILVPFCVESALSGVKKSLMPDQQLWYRRSFKVEAYDQGQKVLLHFGAVDWEATVWVNGQLIGTHQGGYLPFTFDITNYIQEQNELVVAVWDPTDTHWQQRGKQALKPSDVFYTPISGIWQTVWLETVSSVHITHVKLTPDIDHETLMVDISTVGSKNYSILVTASYNGDIVSEATIAGNGDTNSLTLSIENPKLWHPDTPMLYDIRFRLVVNGTVCDDVSSYFAMRKFSVGKDADGVVRMMLNNEPLFQHGPLDQGYWPESLYTPPSEEAILFDLKMMKSYGYNMVRKHIKVEPARWYHHCDKLGLIVWQDMVNGGRRSFNKLEALFYGWFEPMMNVPDNTKRRLRLGNRLEKASRDAFEAELKEMIDTLYNVPSIGVWIPFNEAWGQFDAQRIGEWVQQYDPTRSVDEASGYFHQKSGDIYSVHNYIHKLFMPLKYTNGRAFAISEYGGKILKVKGHMWDDNKAFGYGKFKTSEELTKTYVSIIEKELLPLAKKGCSAAVYTQLSDVEIEINGLVTYDRQVIKMDMEKVAKANKKLYDAVSKK